MAHIFWDFDGTLVQSSPMWRRAMLEALNETSPGHSVTLDHIVPYVSVGFPWHSEDPHELKDSKVWWEHMEEKFARDFIALGFSAERAFQSSRLIKSKILTPRSYKIFPEVFEVLRSLNSIGFRHVIVSNNHPDLETVMVALNLSPLFEHIVTSGKVGFEKPRAEIFDYALSLTGADRQTTWMVGDSYKADVQGAARAGLRAILVRSNDEHRHKASDLAEAMQIICAD